MHMYVCMYAYMHVCMYGWMYACMYMCVCVYIVCAPAGGRARGRGGGGIHARVVPKPRSGEGAASCHAGRADVRGQLARFHLCASAAD